MSRKNRNQKNNVYVVINLITEYGCPLNGCRYAVASSLGEQQLRRDCAKELDPAEIMIEREEAEKKKAFSKKVYEALNSLTETQRRRIIRRYFEEKTLGEIAREEGVSITTVENILKRALHSMRKILDEAEPVKK